MTQTERQESRNPAPLRDVVRVLGDDGTIVDPTLDPGLSGPELVALYRDMSRTRILDERLLTLQRQGRIGFHVGSLGEEATIIGATYALRPQDWIFPCYRESGAAVTRGLPLQAFVDNVFGNANDLVKGRQMPDHHTGRAVRFASTSSPVGTQIPHAVGVAWAAKLRRDDVVTLAFFGDGATSTNDFHAAANLAGVFRLPVILLCRNNGWAISTPVERQTASPTFAEKGNAYGVPGVRVDGNDALAVIAVVRRAVERARSGAGATLIEALTYRMGAHTSSDDPSRYRTESEIRPWVERDPLERVRRLLEARRLISRADDDAYRAEVDRSFREAVAVAECTPPPGLHTLHEDVYATPPWHLVEQREALLRGSRPAAPPRTV
ncbi:MAG: thiamine pyrophosphate-dependent dehydrogenase E1 component subunit alpha [Polyangiaceae bacterium]|nr:thiamine pyrophosphate-dependent dehydrogenase E1 component subunit alpha [Polyangiaceae bacterium]